MQKLFTLILISCSLAATAQNVTLTKADTAKSNAAIRTLQSQYAGLPALDTNTVAKVRNKKVLFLQDAAIPVLQGQVIALQNSVSSQAITIPAQISTAQGIFNSQVSTLQAQDKAAAAAITTLQAQNTSLQVQVNNQGATITALTAQVASLQAIIDKLKIALQ